MITINTDTNRLPADMLAHTYFDVREQDGVVAIIMCEPDDKEFANLKVIHSAMYPGSEQEAQASLIHAVREVLLDRGAIVQETLDWDELIKSASLMIDMERWPDTWQSIQDHLKHPDRHYENGWLDDIYNSIESNDPDVEYVTYEINGMYTHSGNPIVVEIPVEWD